MSSAHDYDVAILAGFGSAGASSADIAHEVLAQHAAGYRTVLVPVGEREGSFDRAILACVQGGMAELAAPGNALRARAAVIRLEEATAAAEAAPSIAADVAVVVAGRPALTRRSVIAATDGLVREAFGRAIWAPVGPDVRASLERSGAGVELTPGDWGQVIDVADGETRGEGFLADQPVIGRHGDADRSDWPQSWTPYPSGGRRARRFLAEIDLLVVLRDPGAEPSSPRPVAEALAAGVPAVLSPDLEPVFGGACLYATPDTAQAQVAALLADPGRFAAQRAAGSAFVAEHFGLDVHARRLAELVGPLAAPAAAPYRRRAERTVLFVSANGEGMGHLTRLLSVVRRVPDDIKPVFATMSPAFRGVREAGFACEYIPRHPSWRGDVWNPFLMRRLGELIARYRARALVFDGTWPFNGLLEAGRLSGCSMVWIRRSMWKAGAGAENLERSGSFSLIVEPGDLAEDRDRGSTVARRHEALRVAPILQLDASELLDRDAARSALGLDPERRAVLIALGSDDRYGLATAARTAAERCVAEGLEVVFADWLISHQRIDLPAEVKRLSVYPLSRYFRAFDFAVARSGYNSFHELIAFGVPSVFLPIETMTDDQYARASWAQDAGVGLALSEFSAAGFERALGTLLDDGTRSGIAARAVALGVGNGAQEAADAIAALAASTVVTPA